ncbi:MAG: 30S ribosomal protein S5 [Patescibacteria group bacterium]|nr:30S ribosomal protein S5 [Patescibacteria group bacterium]
MRGRPRRGPAEEKEFMERVLEINRVSRTVKGGKRIRFRALVVIGDGKGRIGYGVGKSSDVSGAIGKAVTDAKKNLIKVFIKGTTIPYEVRSRYKSAEILLKPAPTGTGVVAGSVLRVVLELTGIKDVVGKVIGASNKLSNTVATVKALGELIDPKEVLLRRGIGKSKSTEKAKS